MTDALIQSVFFLAALVALGCRRSLLSNPDARGFNMVVGGVSLFALVAIGHLWHETGLVSLVGLPDSPFFARLLGWVGIISGVILVTAGLSSWLPVVRKLTERDAGARNRHRFLCVMERLMGMEQSPAVLMEAVVRHAVESFPVRAAAAYRVETATGALALLHCQGTAGFPCEMLKGMRLAVPAVPSAGGNAEIAWDRLLVMPETVPAPALVQPVHGGSGAVYLLLFWEVRSGALANEDLETIRLALDAVGRTLETVAVGREMRQYRRELESARLLQRVATAPDFGAALSVWRDALNMSADGEVGTVSVLLLDRHLRQGRRYTLSRDGRLLTEKRLELPAKLPLISVEKESGVGLVSGTAQAELAALFPRTDRHQPVAMPAFGLDEDCRAVAAMEIAGVPESLVVSAAVELRPWLLREAAEWRRETWRARHERLIDALKTALDATDVSSACSTVAEVVAETCNCSAVRVSALTPDGFLRSLALYSRNREAVVPAAGTQVLSLMPAHREVLSTGRPLQLDREAPVEQCPSSERRQMLVDEIVAATIMPLRRRGRAWGTLTLMAVDGESYDNPLRDERRSLLDLACGVLALLITRRASAPERPDYPEVVLVPSRTTTSESELRSRIRSSLAGIVASLETLRSRPDLSGDELDRLVRIMDTSARKIQRCLTDEMESVLPAD